MKFENIMAFTVLKEIVMALTKFHHEIHDKKLNSLDS
jgi:hypothetical protein